MTDQSEPRSINGSIFHDVTAREGSLVVGGDLTVQDGATRPDAQALLTAYLNRMVDQVRWLNLGGVDPAMATDARRARLSLARVYTELDTLETERPEREREAPAEKIRQPQRAPVVRVMDREGHLVLLGDPGSGKSTFVNFVTLCLAGQELGLEEMNLDHLGQAWTHGWLLPVRVVLRDFVARGLPQVGERVGGDHLWRFLKAELGETLVSFAPSLHKHLQEEGGLVLLDGFDEVPKAEQRRRQVMDAVQGFARDFPRCRFLLTSRTYAWQRQAWRLPGFAEAVLAPFDDEQIETFVDRWYTHVSALRPGEISAEEAQGRATLLKYAIEHTPGLRELACRPLLLTLMASLHAWRGGSLPEKREQLYDDTLDLLLNVWERPKIVRDGQGNEMVVQPAVREWLQAPRDKLLKALEGLGYEAHAGQPALEGTADVPEARLVQTLWEMRGNPDLRRKRIVEYIRDRAGLLVPRGVGVYTFPHRTFQEYLAARYLTEANWPDEMAALVLEDPERWREVALLAAAKVARGTSYAVWGLVEALASEPPPETPDPRAGWAAFIGAAALIENGLHESVPSRHRKKVARLQQWLAAVLEKALLPPVERAAAGRVLARLGDPRNLDELVFVPGGSFLMGSREDDEGAYSDEYPQHTVHVADFSISKYPITNTQYARFVQAGGYDERKFWTEAGWAWRQKREREKPGYWGDPTWNLPNHPVVGVNWYEALAYTRWLAETTGRPYRLPTEAEWEKAARGTDGRTYPWGDDEITPQHANYDQTGIGQTSPVGCFPAGASPYGVLDMVGNVWEWCSSVGYTEAKYPYQADDGRENLEGETVRALRGGSWYRESRSARCAYRGGFRPDGLGGNNGFRVVLPGSQPSAF